MDEAHRITRLENALIDLTTVIGERDFSRFLRHVDPAVGNAAERVWDCVAELRHERGT